MRSPKLSLLFMMYILHFMSSLLKIIMCFMVASEILVIFYSRYVYIYTFDGSVLGILQLARCVLSIWLLILRLYKDSINLKIVNIISYPSNLWTFLKKKIWMDHGPQRLNKFSIIVLFVVAPFSVVHQLLLKMGGLACLSTEGY